MGLLKHEAGVVVTRQWELSERFRDTKSENLQEMRTLPACGCLAGNSMDSFLIFPATPQRRFTHNPLKHGSLLDTVLE